MLVLVGVLGGYTTFSTFGRDTFELWQQGDRGHAALYVPASMLLSLASVWLGALLGQMVQGTNQG